MRIIFFHHAGGDQYAFSGYKDLLQSIGWEMTVYEFPGHGDRFNETLIDDALRLADDAYSSLQEVLTGDYLIFGNSMGSLLGYLLLHRIREEGNRMPLHYFAAARKCPASYPLVLRNEPLTDEAFWQMIADYGGPAALIGNVELQELYGPILRADYNILETYDHVERPKLSVPATVLFGNEDRYDRQSLLSWEQHFEQHITLHEFDGGHFFVYEQPENVLEVIHKRINS